MTASVMILGMSHLDGSGQLVWTARFTLVVVVGAVVLGAVAVLIGGETGLVTGTVAAVAILVAVGGRLGSVVFLALSGSMLAMATLLAVSGRVVVTATTVRIHRLVTWHAVPRQLVRGLRRTGQGGLALELADGTFRKI